MYIPQKEHQIKFDDFNQPLSLQMDPDNRWVKLAKCVPWGIIEEKYAKLFPSHTGMPAKPLQMALGSVLIQRKTGLVDRDLVQTIMENPYMQFFIGLPGYSYEQPFAPSLMVEFRKRLTSEIIDEINELIIEYNTQNDDTDNHNGPSDSDSDTDSESENHNEHEKKGTLILDATCAPQYIRYPQDINLLNEAREDPEGMIDEICKENKIKKPRMHRNKARKHYPEIAKDKKRGGKKMRKGIKRQIQYIRRDLGYVDNFLAEGFSLKQKVRIVWKQSKSCMNSRSICMKTKYILFRIGS